MAEEFPLTGKGETQSPFLKTEKERPREYRPVNSISVLSKMDSGLETLLLSSLRAHRYISSLWAPSDSLDGFEPDLLIQWTVSRSQSLPLEGWCLLNTCLRRWKKSNKVSCFPQGSHFPRSCFYHRLISTPCCLLHPCPDLVFHA